MHAELLNPHMPVPATGIVGQLLGGLGGALLGLPHVPHRVVGELEIPQEVVAGAGQLPGGGLRSLVGLYEHLLHKAEADAVDGLLMGWREGGCEQVLVLGLLAWEGVSASRMGWLCGCKPLDDWDAGDLDKTVEVIGPPEADRKVQET